MSNWKNVELGTVCEVVRGGSPRPIIDYITDSPDGVNWLKIGDVKENDKFFTHATERIKQSGIPKTREVKAGDLILSNSMSFGRAFITLIDGYIHDGWLRLRCNEEMLDKEYLYYFLTSKLAQNQFKAVATGSVVNNLKSDTVKAVRMNLPSLEEQQKIAAVLSLLDDKIKRNEEINENLQQQAFAFFEQLLSRSKCDLCMLTEIAELNPKRQLAKGMVARCIDMAQLSTSGTFPNGWEMKPYNGGMRFSNGDTIIARITPCLENGKTAFIDFLDNSEVAFGSTEYIVLSSKGIFPAEFFYCLARYPAFVDYAVKNMNGSSGRQRVSADTIGKYLLPRVSEEEIHMFRETVTPLFKEMRNNSLENIRLAALRDALLPKLMSGELDVSDMDL